MPVRVGIVTFPGSLDDRDAARAVRIAGAVSDLAGAVSDLAGAVSDLAGAVSDLAGAVSDVAGAEAVPLWHADPSLHDVAAVILPGGFSYGDYLRCGAIASLAPVMTTIVDAARDGLPVLGICNGFQVLCESHLLPGALIRNDHRKFVCRDQPLRIENNTTVWTNGFDAGAEIVVPLKNGEGGYVADQRTLDELEAHGRVVARYVGGNPNGSYRDIAGISNVAGNVVGLMPHPEHAVDALTGPSTDGLPFFTSVLAALVAV